MANNNLTAQQAEHALWAAGLGETTYNIKYGTVVVGQPLQFQHDYAVDMADGGVGPAVFLDRDLGMQTPPEFEVTRVFNINETGAQAFIAYNKTTNTVFVGASGMDGFIKSGQDSESGALQQAVNQVESILTGADGGTPFIEQIMRNVSNNGNQVGDLKIILGGQSMGSDIIQQLSAAIILGVPVLDSNGEYTIGKSALNLAGFNPANLEAYTYNGLGSYYGMKLRGYDDATINAIANSGAKFTNFVVTNGYVPGDAEFAGDVVHAFGGGLMGPYLAIPYTSTMQAYAEASGTTIATAHRNNYGIYGGIKDALGGDLRNAQSFTPSFIDHFGVSQLTKLFTGGNGGMVTDFGGNFDLAMGGLFALSIAPLGQGMDAMAPVMQQNFGLSLRDAQGLAGIIEASAKYWLLTNPAGWAATMLVSLGVSAGLNLFMSKETIPSDMDVDGTIAAAKLNNPLSSSDAERYTIVRQNGWSIVDLYSDRVEILDSSTRRTINFFDGASLETLPNGISIFKNPENNGYVQFGNQAQFAISFSEYDTQVRGVDGGIILQRKPITHKNADGVDIVDWSEKVTVIPNGNVVTDTFANGQNHTVVADYNTTPIPSFDLVTTRLIDGHLVTLTYGFDENTGMHLSNIVLIDGVPPENPGAALNDLQQAAGSDSIFTGGEISPDVTKVINAHTPAKTTAWKTFETSVAATSDALNTVLAISSGKPLPFTASGLHLINDLTLLSNPKAKLPVINGSASVLDGVLGIKSLQDSLDKHN